MKRVNVITCLRLVLSPFLPPPPFTLLQRHFYSCFLMESRLHVMKLWAVLVQ
jgi:hypothetical protein